jgi:hypothetical protein
LRSSALLTGSPTAPNRTFRDGRHNRACGPRVQIRFVKVVILRANGARDEHCKQHEAR